MKKLSCAVVVMALSVSLLKTSARADPGVRPGLAPGPSRAEEEEPEQEKERAIKNETRASSLSVTPTLGQHSYKAFDLSARVGIDPVWQATGLGRVTNAGPGQISRELRLGADARVSDQFSAHASFVGTEEPGDVSSRGLAPGVSWAINPYWHSQLESILFLDTAFQTYSQSVTTRRRVRLGPSVRQTQLTLGVTQELVENFSATVSYSSYHYSADPKILSDAVASRPTVFSGISGVVDGFPKSSASLDLDWKVSSHWGLNGSISSTRLAIDNSKSTSGALSVSYELNEAWTFALNTSRSHSASTGSISEFGATITYGW